MERDLFVGLNLGLFQVLGGGLNQSGVDQVDVEVGKNIQGIDVPHGIFNSFITAGVLIDGGTRRPRRRAATSARTAPRRSSTPRSAPASRSATW